MVQLRKTTYPSSCGDGYQWAAAVSVVRCAGSGCQVPLSARWRTGQSDRFILSRRVASASRHPVVIIMMHQNTRAGGGRAANSVPPCVAGSFCPRPRLMTAFSTVGWRQSAGLGWWQDHLCARPQGVRFVRRKPITKPPPEKFSGLHDPRKSECAMRALA
jgi:hypothetical protein